MDIKGSTCIVTGATEGIGRAITEALARRGARLAVCARTEHRVAALLNQLTGEGIEVVGEACDVADESRVSSFANMVRERLGPVDVLINNAGLGHWCPVEEMSVAEFDQTMAVNVRGVFLMTRAILPEMKRRGRGHIVNIASLAGKNGVPGAAAYSASKHAVLGFSKSLFLEVRKHNIRVLAICPGSVVTPFFEKSGVELSNPDQKLQPNDVASCVISALEIPDRALLSEIDIRPNNP